jgi:hypothetical protein
VERPSVNLRSRTLEQLESAFDAVGADLAPRVEELAQKSTAGVLTRAELAEYGAIVRLNDLLSLLRVETKEASRYDRSG